MVTSMKAVAATPSACARVGAGVSPLTGKRGHFGVPVVAKINNVQRAWPQSGLESADLNFVEEIENGATRHLAVFSSTYPRRVGSIRSARETDLELMSAFGHPAFVYSGAAKVMMARIKKAALPAFSEAMFPSGLTRDAGKRKTNGSTQSLYADLGKVAAAAPARGAKPLSRQSWCFGAAQPGGGAISQLKVVWKSMSVAGTWNAKAQQWTMSYRLYNGKPHPAVNESGQSFTADNVVVLLTTRTTARIGYSGGPLQTAVPFTHTIGNGRALVMRDGKAYSAAWSRTAQGAFRLTSPGGHPIRLHTGRTWFLLASQDRKLTVTARGARPVTAVLPTGRTIPASITRAILDYRALPRQGPR
jgi:hypothetical protein